MNSLAKEITREIELFPAMPALCKFVSTHLNDPNVDFRQLAEQLKYDPGMTANVLKLANSAYFGAIGRVDSLQTAIARVGMKRMFQLVIASGISKTLVKPLGGYNLRPEELLMHSVFVAVASEELARVTGVHSPELLFTAGLLHDMGKVILDKHLEKTGNKFLEKFSQELVFFDVMEQEFLGMGHAEVGGMLLEKWKFPHELVSAARFHHDPEKTTAEDRTLVNVVHISDMLSYSEGIGTGIDGLRYRTSREAISSLGLKTSILEMVTSHSMGKVEELEKVLCGESGKVVKKEKGGNRR